MRTILIIILFFITIRVFAPGVKVILIERAKALSQFDKLIEAVSWVESTHGKYLYNSREGAVGWLQIRQCRLDDYNKKTGSHYKLQDCYDYELSRRIFLYYSHGKNYEKAARDWNGSGYKTITYWNKVKMYLN
jgi:hypothetical protein